MKLSFPSSYTVLILISIVIAAATFLLPAGNYQYLEADGSVVAYEDKTNSATPIPGSYAVSEQQPQGWRAVAMAPIKGFVDAQDIIIFVLVLGGFINIALRSGAIDNGVLSLVKRFKGREQMMIPLLMLIFAVGGTTFGMGEETVGFYPVIIPIMLVAGFDTLTAAATILLGAGAGVLASTVNPFATGVGSAAVGISLIDGALLRLVIFFLCVAVAIAFVLRYAMKVKKNPKASYVYATRVADRKRFLGSKKKSSLEVKVTFRQKLVLLVFAASFAIMIYGVIPFADLKITIIPTWNWWFNEISRTFIIASILMGIVAGMSEKQLVDSFLDGVKDLSSVAIIIGVARGIKILMYDGQIAGTLLNFSEELVTGLSSFAFISGAYLVELFLSFLIPSSSGLAVFSLPILAPIASFAEVAPSLVVTAYQSANGLVNLITPTSAILMAGLTISKIPFYKWLVFVLPLILLFASISVLSMMMSIFLA